MRRLMFAACALAALALRPAMAERQCASSAVQSAFEIQALRSELMVLATGCHDDDGYNALIRRYQSYLQANEREIDSYFKRRYGRSAQFQHDRFVTDLANAMSRQGSELGGDFCPRNGMIFREVMALKTASELPDFAAGKDLIPPTIDVCTGPAAPAAPIKARKAATKTAKK